MAPDQSTPTPTPAPVRAGGTVSDNDDEFDYSYIEDRSKPKFSKAMMEMSHMWPVKPRLYEMVRVKTPKKRGDGAPSSSMMPPPSAGTVDGQGGARSSSQAPTLVGEQDTDFEKKGKDDATPHRKKKKRRRSDRDQLPLATPRQEPEGNDEEAAGVEDSEALSSKKKKKKKRGEEQQSSQNELAPDEPNHMSQQQKKKKKSKHRSSSSQAEPAPEDVLDDPAQKKKKKRTKSHVAESSQPEPQHEPSEPVQPPSSPSPPEPELPATPSPEPRPVEPVQRSPERPQNLGSQSQGESIEQEQAVDASPRKRKRARKERFPSATREVSEEQVVSAPIESTALPVRKRKESPSKVGDVQEPKKRRLGSPEDRDASHSQMDDEDVNGALDIDRKPSPHQISSENLPSDIPERELEAVSQDDDDDDMDEQELLNAQIFSSQQQIEPDIDGYNMDQDDVAMETVEDDQEAAMSETGPQSNDAAEEAPSAEGSPEPVEDENNLNLDDEPSQSSMRGRTGHARQRAPKKPWTQDSANHAEDDLESSRQPPEARTPVRTPARKKAPSTKTATPSKKKKLRERMRGGTSDRELGPKETSARRRRSTKEKKPITTEGLRSAHEETALKEVFKDFIATYGLIESAANDLVHENPTQESGRDARKMKKDFWQRAEDACPGRDRKSLMSCCRRLFHNRDRGEWSEEQKNQLHDLFEKHGRNFKLIGSIVNRDRMDVRHYYSTVYRCLGKQKKGKWTPEEEEQYLSIVQSMLMENRKKRSEDPQNTPSRKKAGPDDENLINWEEVSVRMGYTRNEKQCRTKWSTLREKGLVTLGDETPRPSSHKAQLDLDRKTLRLMKQADITAFVQAVETCGAEKSKDIPWGRLVNPPFRRKWKRPTLQLLWSRLSKTVPDSEELSVPEIAHYLVEQCKNGDKLEILQDDEVNEAEEAKIVGGLWNTPAATPKRRQARVVSAAVAIDSSDSEQDDGAEGQEEVARDEELSDADADHEMDDIASEQDGSTHSVDLSLVTASEEPAERAEKETHDDESNGSPPAVDTLD